jgi:hypothetical protein
MGREGGEQAEQGHELGAVAAVLLELIEQRHHRGDGGVELHALDVVADLFDGLVHRGLVGGGIALARLQVLGQVPYALQEPLEPLTALRRTSCAAFSKSPMNMI